MSALIENIGLLLAAIVIEGPFGNCFFFFFNLNATLPFENDSHLWAREGKRSFNRTPKGLDMQASDLRSSFACVFSKYFIAGLRFPLDWSVAFSKENSVGFGNDSW